VVSVVGAVGGRASRWPWRVDAVGGVGGRCGRWSGLTLAVVVSMRSVVSVVGAVGGRASRWPWWRFARGSAQCAARTTTVDSAGRLSVSVVV
jgi:hypothetical protein